MIQARRAARETNLKVIPGTLEPRKQRTGKTQGRALPAHLERVVEGVWSELRKRSFKPLWGARSLEQAHKQAPISFTVFLKAWPAVFWVLDAWTKGDPERLKRLIQGARSADFWNTRLAHSRLGMQASANWEAAQDARIHVARTVVQLPNAALPDLERDESLLLALANADFALLFGTSVLRERRKPHLAHGVADWFSSLALAAARQAYSIVAAPFYTE